MRLFFGLILLVFAVAASAQQPVFVHADVTTQNVDGTLGATIAALEKSSTPLWVGYSIPTEKEFRSGWNDAGVAYLEKRDSYNSTTEDKNAPSGRAILLIRLAGGKVDQLRAESTDRKIDGGDLRVVWLANVTPEESVATLKQLVTAPGSKQVRDNVVFLISLHKSPAALPALAALAGPGNELAVRDKAAFWMANQRGREGFLVIQKLAETDADPAFREKLTFDLTLTKEPDAVDELIRMAHEDATPRVRTQAQFWLAQSARKLAGANGDKLAAASLRKDADADPDADSRRQAVFAISRLPGDQAVTQLTELASTSSHPEVREQAVFWLGQSKDPRALEYLTKLLKSDPRR